MKIPYNNSAYPIYATWIGTGRVLPNYERLIVIMPVLSL